MTLVKYNRPNGMRTWKTDWPSLINDFFGNDLSAFRGNDVTNNLPAVNIRETETEYLLELAAPGLKKSDFIINIEDNTLTIKSETKSDVEDKKEGYTRREFSYSSFTRSFTLPEWVEQDSVSAKYENGVLNVAIPKKKEVVEKNKPRAIKVS